MAALLTQPAITIAAMSVFKDFDIFIYAYCERALYWFSPSTHHSTTQGAIVSNPRERFLSLSSHFPNYRPFIPRIATRKAWSRGCESDRETRLNRQRLKHRMPALASKACLLSCSDLCWRSGRGGYRIWLRSQRRPQSARRLWPSPKTRPSRGALHRTKRPHARPCRHYLLRPMLRFHFLRNEPTSTGF